VPQTATATSHQVEVSAPRSRSSARPAIVCTNSSGVRGTTRGLHRSLASADVMFASVGDRAAGQARRDGPPVTGFPPNFSPIPRMAPPPLGRDTPGRGPGGSGDAGAATLGEDAILPVGREPGVIATGRRGQNSHNSNRSTEPVWLEKSRAGKESWHGKLLPAHDARTVASNRQLSGILRRRDAQISYFVEAPAMQVGCVHALQLLRRSLPGNGVKRCYCFGPLCEKPRSCLYAWEVIEDRIISRPRQCRRCAGLRY
jgi:hypothetical protein